MSDARFTISASDRTKAAFASVEKNLKGISDKVLSLKGAILGLAGVAGFGALVGSSMKAMDATAKFGDAIGIATKDLTQLQYAAAETAGVTDQTFNLALRRMTRRIAEAAQGAGPAKDALKELGLSAQELKDAGPAEAFRRVADAMKDTTSQGDRLRIAFKLFDTDGGALVNTLAEGREGLAAYAAEADALGKSFDRVDAAKIEAANGSIDRVKSAIQGVGNRIAISLAPYLEAIGDLIADAAVKSGGFKDAIISAMRGAVDAVAFFGDTVRGLQVVWKGVELIVRGFGATVLSVVELANVSFREFVNLMIAGLNSVIEQMNKIPGVQVDLIKRMEEGNLGGFIAEQAEIARQGVVKTRDELAELAMQKMPSDGIKATFAEIEQRAEESAQKIAKRTEEIRANANAGGGGGDNKELEQVAAQLRTQEETIRASYQRRNEIILANTTAGSEQQQELLQRNTEKLQEELDRRVAAVVASLQTETERVSEQYNSQREIILASVTLTEERKTELLVQLRLARDERLAEIDLASQERERANLAAHQGSLLGQQLSFISQLERAQQASGARQVGIYSNAFAQITAAGSQHSRKLFELNKVAGISNAIISTYQGAAKALELGWPMGPIAAAAIIASGMAQVASIRSATYGSGTAPSVGATPAPPVTPVDVPQIGSNDRQGTVVNVTFTGNVSTFTPEELTQTIQEGLSEAINDRDVMLFDPDSRQGRALAGR